MSDHSSDKAKAPEGSPPPAGHAPGSKKKASPITPTPVKKSKRQAERMARGAFAASLRKEEEENRLYQPKKSKTKKRPKPDSENNISSNNNNNAKGKSKQSLSDGEASPKALQVVTPSPTQSPVLTKSSKIVSESAKIPFEKNKPSEPASLPEAGGQNGKRSREKSGPSNRKRRKLVYKAISGPERPIYGYALHLVSLVCNSSYSVTKISSGNHRKSTSKTSSPKNNTLPTTHNNNSSSNNNKETMLKNPQQPHRVLDRPSNGYTQDSEPIKERLMRLQLRQRFASAASIGMSPIEFARKLLKLWGGTLEQVYETITPPKAKTNGTSTTGKKSNNCSSSLTKRKPTNTEQSEKGKFQSKLGEDLATMSSDGLKAAIESCDFEKSIGDLEPRSIHPDAQLGENSKANGNNGLHFQNNLGANGAFYDPSHRNSNGTNNNVYNFQHNNISTKLNTQIFGESNARIERSKKLLKRRHLKNLKKAEGKALPVPLISSMAVDPLVPITATCDSALPNESIDTERNSPPKRKAVKRTPRKFTDNPEVPVLFKDLRLAHPDDETHLNALHCFVRTKLLEVYVLQGGKTTKGKQEKEIKYEKSGSDDGKVVDEETPNIVGIRCAFCGPLSKNERGKGQSMPVFFPKSIGEIYRGVCTWQRIHFPVCEHVPEEYRIEYKVRKERDLTRGKKVHWVKSAYDLGLRNIDSERNGLTYKPGSPYDLDEVLKTEIDPGGRPKHKRKQSLSSPESEAALVSRGKIQGSSISPAFAGGDDEFELFGNDFDRSLEEPTVAVAATKSDEVSF